MTACPASAGLALFLCLAADPRCLPPEVLAMPAEPRRAYLRHVLAIGQQESGLRPYAIRDEATGESLFPTTHAEAVRIATGRDALGHTLGLGAWQITHRANWRRHGLTIATALEPCASLRAGAAHHAGDLRNAALQLYNSGRIGGAPRYAAQVEQRIAALGDLPLPAPAAEAPPAALPSPPLPAMDRGRPARDLVIGR